MYPDSSPYGTVCAGGPGLLLSRASHFHLPAATVFSLLTSESDACQWLSAEVELEAVPGGTIVVAADGFPVIRGRVVELQTPHTVTFEWLADGWSGPLSTRIDVIAESDSCSVQLQETGYGDDDELLRTRGWLWSHWLVRLAAIGGELQGRA